MSHFRAQACVRSLLPREVARRALGCAGAAKERVIVRPKRKSF
jgi:hypothetical protein